MYASHHKILKNETYNSLLNRIDPANKTFHPRKDCRSVPAPVQYKRLNNVKCFNETNLKIVYTAYTFPQPMPKLTTPSRRGFSCQSWEVYSSDRDKIEKLQVFVYFAQFHFHFFSYRLYQWFKSVLAWQRAERDPKLLPQEPILFYQYISVIPVQSGQGDTQKYQDLHSILVRESFMQKIKLETNQLWLENTIVQLERDKYK